MPTSDQRARSRARIEERVARTLKLFPSLPDDALIDDRTVAALLGRSRPSVWRDVAGGRIPAPIKVGARSTRWRVGEIRQCLANCGKREAA